ncbi:efflux RND transporter periplasmic adaptor subunit [Sphingomonas sp. HT-1]|uniref:efflux RND transporter periplasmic adaptor subunit n=1 Tax=unclassified Sphingomonas TaxID=196159 RepID=UPI001EF0F8C4|nr:MULTISPECIES: efflux RND transporter periplasmic adaptor subunit [unclassified Sphingomonas]
MSGNIAEHTELPATPRLLPRAQLLLLAAIVAAVIVIGIAVLSVQAMLAPKPVPEAKLPPGSFRPSAEQLGQMGFAVARAGANAELVRASGSILPDGDHSTPIILPFTGQVLQVLVEAGQRVTRGQPLLRLASPDLVDARNALRNAAAQRASAEEALNLARANLARQKAITETAGGAMKDYLQAQADFVAAQSAARQAESALRAAQDRLALFGNAGGSGTSATITYPSPVSGIVADRAVAPGQYLGTGTTNPVMTITDPARVWLVAQLPEGEAAAIRLGDQVTVTTPALPGRSFSATIDNVAAGLDPVTHRLPVRASIANPDGALKPQMFAAFTIRQPIGSGAPGVLVPAVAVIHEGDSARIWVRDASGLLIGRPVTIGETEAGFTRVLSGLKPGEQVVTHGALFVNEAGIDQ